MPICAKIELEIAQLDAADAAAFMADLGLRESGLDRVIRASYDLLGYISFFTVGEDENRAWSIPRGTHGRRTPAGEIHTDIQRGFIRAEVVRYEHLLARGSLAACREHGELRLEGKDYIVLDGDVINFRHADMMRQCRRRFSSAKRRCRSCTAAPRVHVRELLRELQARGYEAELVSVPFKWYPKDEILPHAAAWRLLDLSESNGRPIDLVIGTKFPTYFARHPEQSRVAHSPVPRGLRAVRARRTATSGTTSTTSGCAIR